MLAEMFDQVYFKKYGTSRLAATIIVAMITLGSLWEFIAMKTA